MASDAFLMLYPVNSRQFNFFLFDPFVLLQLAKSYIDIIITIKFIFIKLNLPPKLSEVSRSLNIVRDGL